MGEEHILVIDDEQRLLADLRMLLTHEGYVVTTAADGREGVQCLQQHAFDLVITDIKMAGFSGFEVMEHIATHFPDTPVIVITGYASTTSAVEALRKGAYDYISKPFEVEMMKISIERALEKARLQRELKRHMEELEQRVAARTRDLEIANEKLNHSLVELKATQNQLIQTEKLSALGELISGFAHELNNPLTSVLGYAELLAKPDLWPDDRNSMVGKIRQEAVRCHQIVKNLLGFARKQQPEKKPVNLNVVCLQVLDLLNYQFKVNNITVVQQFTPDLPEFMADEHQLQQVLVNILTNAYQAISGQQGSGQIVLTTSYDKAQVAIEITDDGPGLAAPDLHRIFDPFFTTKEEGTGLGLSLSYGIIKEHGGDITVSSTPGQGTTFCLTLPRRAEKPSGTSTVPAAEAPPVATKRLLVVDDEPTILQLLVDILQVLGHQADAASNGQEAIEKLQSIAYDLIICDLKMPEVDGYQVYNFLAAHRPEAVNRLIVTSGDTVSEEHRRFLSETGCLFLHKPFRIEDVQQIVQQAASETAP